MYKLTPYPHQQPPAPQPRPRRYPHSHPQVPAEWRWASRYAAPPSAGLLTYSRSRSGARGRWRPAGPLSSRGLRPPGGRWTCGPLETTCALLAIAGAFFCYVQGWYLCVDISGGLKASKEPYCNKKKWFIYYQCGN